MTSENITTGTLDFKVGEETYQTWYKVVGDLKSGKRPLVLLHGGPGSSHDYILPHVDLYTSLGIPLIFYDQTGGGQSTHLKDKPKDFWTVELFMNELDNVLSHFGIADDFDLLGQSWGGMLAAQYAATRQPSGLQHLIIADSPASMPLWEVAVGGLLKGLPVKMQETIARHEAEGTTDSKEYQDVMNIFYGKHLCRVNPWPEELVRSFSLLETDPTVYQTMQGPSEFTITGSLKQWTIVDIVHSIQVVTLVINGAFDEAQDVCVSPFFEKIPKVKWVTFANSSHTPFFEERERYMKVVGGFLTNN
ncbi:proline-specific peptidase [Cyathus striatus]|nr:proline-specific peptidase [Cyathus striatus]